MKRDPRLQPLSHDHHLALVVARHMLLALDEGRVDEARAELRERHGDWLEPHFGAEEAALLQALEATGELALVAQVRVQHGQLREGWQAALEADADRLRAFALLLREHVRFEERELFPRCEQLLDDAALEAIEAASGGPAS